MAERSVIVRSSQQPQSRSMLGNRWATSLVQQVPSQATVVAERRRICSDFWTSPEPAGHLNLVTMEVLYQLS
jgi:hypothetical protein